MEFELKESEFNMFEFFNDVYFSKVFLKIDSNIC
jgi:hypothetical protein